MIFKSNFLRVSKVHKIYYEVCGDLKGEVVLFVHGGPGAGFSEKDKRFFDFDKQAVIFFDQRGASKSIPFGLIEENTTQHLVNDINKLLNHLGVRKVILFGGSWGTTLSLVFAIQNPEKVKGLLLRGLFLANKESIDYFLNGGVEGVYPKIWKRFRKNKPDNSTLSIPEFYLEKMINGTPEEKKFYAYEWAFFEISVYKKSITPKEVDQILNTTIPYQSLAVLEAHYMCNYCFIEENYILKNLERLKKIPIKIVHGNEDIICPLKFAIQFNDELESSTLFITKGGHSDSEPETEKKLIEIIAKNDW